MLTQQSLRSLVDDLLAAPDAPRYLLHLLLFYEKHGLREVEKYVLDNRLLSAAPPRPRSRHITSWPDEQDRYKYELDVRFLLVDWASLHRDTSYGELLLALLEQAISVDEYLHSDPDAAGWPALERGESSYRLVPQNGHLVRQCIEGTTALEQGNDVRRWILRFSLLEQRESRGVRLDSRALHRWAPLELQRALRSVRSLKVRLEPLQATSIHCGMLERYEGACEADEPAFAVPGVDDGVTLQSVLLERIEQAALDEVTVLVFPELCATQACIDAVRSELEARKRAFPVLIVLARVHHREVDNKVNNRALLLSLSGDVLHYHDKTEPYMMARSREPVLGSVAAALPRLREDIDQGDVITVLESPIGNIVLVICVELFHGTTTHVLHGSHANLVLVPSLSHTTSAHINEAQSLARKHLKCTFVANHWPDGDGNHWTFCCLPKPTSAGGLQRQLTTLDVVLNASA
jgi:hypothetical protein